MQKTTLLAILLLLGAGLAAGCAKVEAKAPQGLYRAEPPPLSAIQRADPKDKADLLRENQQLRDRLDWLGQRAEKSDKKYQSLGKEEQEVQAEMKRLDAEINRYQQTKAK